MQKNNQVFIFCQTVISDSLISFSVLGSALLQLFSPLFLSCVFTNWYVFLILVYCTRMLLSGCFWWSFCCWLKISPLAAKGWRRHMQYAWNCRTTKEEVSGAFWIQMLRVRFAGCRTLSRPPKAIEGITQWPADWTKWWGAPAKSR